MTKSSLFKAAHALTRKVLVAGDDYRVTFGAALKSLMSEPVDVAKRLIAIGGSLWEKNGMRRVYFNNAAELYGLSYSTYKTGNISGASLNGLPISNSEAKRILDRIGRVYFDLNTSKIAGTYSEQSTLDVIAAKIRAAI